MIPKLSFKFIGYSYTVAVFTADLSKQNLENVSLRGNARIKVSLLFGIFFKIK